MAHDAGGVTPTEAMRQALAELGDVPNGEFTLYEDCGPTTHRRA